MIVYHLNRSGRQQLVLHYGIGLIGSAIQRSISSSPYLVSIKHVSFSWTQGALDFDEIDEYLAEYLSSSVRLTLLWSAGVGGFGMNAEEASSEYIQYEQVVRHYIQWATKWKLTSRILLISSAGGLFEGSVGVDRSTPLRIMRPYGELKIQQEQLAESVTSTDAELIMLRPSTVYAIEHHRQHRNGLIQVILDHMASGEVTNIFGSQNTMRDYISAEAMATYIVSCLLSFKWELPRVRYAIFGKPTSIFEIIQHLQSSTGRQLKVQYSLDQHNSAHITFHPSLRPDSLSSMGVLTNMSAIWKRQHG